MTNATNATDERRARAIRAFFPHQPDIWDDVANNAAAAIRASDEAAGMVLVPREVPMLTTATTEIRALKSTS